MRKLYVAEFISLDGVIDSPRGRVRLCPHRLDLRHRDGPEGHAYESEEVRTPRLLLATTTSFRAWLPGRENDPERATARTSSSSRSTSDLTILTDPLENTTVLVGDVVEAVRNS